MTHTHTPTLEKRQKLWFPHSERVAAIRAAGYLCRDEKPKTLWFVAQSSNYSLIRMQFASAPCHAITENLSLDCILYWASVWKFLIKWIPVCAVSTYVLTAFGRQFFSSGCSMPRILSNTCLFAPAPPHRKNNSNEFYALSVNLHAPWIHNEMFTRQNAVRFITEQFENMLLYVACRHGCYFIARFRLDLCKLRRCIDETPFELVGKIDFTVASHFFFGKLSGA